MNQEPHVHRPNEARARDEDGRMLCAWCGRAYDEAKEPPVAVEVIARPFDTSPTTAP